MDKPVKTIQVGRYSINIWHDSNPMNPRTECDNAGTMICFHRRYNLGDKHEFKSANFNSWDGLRQLIEDELHAAICLPLYLYDHSGLTISTNPFSCPWDSGQVGFICMSEEKLASEFGGDYDKGRNCLVAEVSCYDDYLRGECYGYVVELNGEEIESCWGYLGDIKYCEDDAMCVVKLHQKQEELCKK